MSNYPHDTSTADPKTFTVPDGLRARRYACVAVGGGGTITITPKGGTAQPVITVLGNGTFGDEFLTHPAEGDEELPGGSQIVFAGMATCFVRYTK